MMVSIHLRSVWQNIKDFLATHTLSSIAFLAFLFLLIFLLWPMMALLVKSLAGPEGLTLQYFKEFVTRGYYYGSFYNTLLLGILTTSVCLSIGFTIAYLTTRGPRYLRTPLRLITLLPLVAPPFIFALSFVILFGRSGIITQALGLKWSIYGFPGVVLAQSLAFLPLAYIIIENTLSSLDPNLEDSAANLGATEGKILRTITIPLLIPGFWKAALIVYVLAIEEFGNAALLSGRVAFLAPDTWMMIIGTEADFNMGSVLSIFLLLPCIIIFIIQNYLIGGKGYATIVGKPVAAEPRHISPHILIPMIVISFIACGLILLSFGVVGVGAFTKIVGINNTFVVEHILDPRSNSALVNSTTVSLLTGLLGAILGILLAYAIVRGKFRGRATLEGISLVGFAFPGTAMGVGYLLAFNQPPLYLTGTMIVLVLCSICRAFVVSEEVGITKLQQLSIEVEEASLNLGASTITTFRRIVLPIIFPAAMYGFMYIFMRTMITLSAVIFLISPGYFLASVFIFESATYAELGVACATTLKLIVIVGICLAIMQYVSKWTGLSVTRRG